MQVVPSVYTTLDCVIIAIFSFLLGASAFYLLSIRFRTPEKERIEQEAEQKEAGSELALEVQDADTQVPETSKSSAGVTSEDEAGLLKILKGNEKRVIEALMEYGEMNQADLSARTGIPKSTLSRILRDLEDRGLVFRYDYGMSKMVKLDSKKSV
ncbi:MarR family transcriptional regulator [Methanophagales archaeon]|nr:MAG: MarR family transcriptional regulator [Methanophagales archaeon]